MKLEAFLQDTERTMQLATVHEGRPWICTVWFVADDGGNLYWVSFPDAQHSQDVEKDPNVAAAIVIRAEMPTKGLQITGTAKKVDDEEVVERVMKLYVQKYGMGSTFAERFRKGKNKHVLYCLTPGEVRLHDEGKSIS